jgi:hypothetical protein
MVVKDDERRKTLPKSYANDLLGRWDNFTVEDQAKLLERVNKGQREGELRMSDTMRYVNDEPVESSDNKAHAIDISIDFWSHPIVIEEGKDNEVMNQFKALVAKTMNITCDDMFAHGIPPLPEGNVKEKKDMFVIPEFVATGDFWSNLLDQIKFTVKKINSREMTNWQRRRIPEVVRETAGWYDLYLDEYRKQVSGAIRKRPKVCRIEEKDVYEEKYIVEQKFPLTANTFYLLLKKSGIQIPNMLPELKF